MDLSCPHFPFFVAVVVMLPSHATELYFSPVPVDTELFFSLCIEEEGVNN